MPDMVGQRPATCYFCPNEGRHGAGLAHDRGTGQPPRRKCRGCGGQLLTRRGWYGVFKWTGNGRYPLENAVHVYTFEWAAQRRADKMNAQERHGPGGMVVRWIPKGEET